MDVSVLKRKEEFFRLQDIWVELMEVSGQTSLHMTWPFVSTWVQIYTDDSSCRLQVIVLQNDSRVMAIAPLMVVTRRSRIGIRYRELRFLCEGGEVGFEYLNFLCRPGTEKVILPLICEEIQKMGFERISLSGTTASGLLSVVPNGRICSEKITRYAPLPQSWDNYFQSRPKNFRQNLRTFQNRCKKDDLSLKFLFCGKDIDFEYGFNELVRLNQERWGIEGESFQTRNYIEFQRQVMWNAFQEERLFLCFLLTNEEIVAANYSIRYRDTVFIVQMGRSPNYLRYGVGHLLLAEVIKEAIRHGSRKVDFLGGDSFYKQCWADATCQLITIVAEKNGFRSFFLVGEDLLIQLYRKSRMSLKSRFFPGLYKNR
jgi:hypothetical protein